MVNFWKTIDKPFLVLAPMEDVTDYVFREIVCGVAKPDVLFTEFTSADGLMFNANERGFMKLKFSERQRPIVAQLWGSNPETMFKAAKIVEKYGFDGIDVNMGCPDRNVVKKHAGAGLIGDYDRAIKVIEAIREGAPSIPFSVKTRIRKKNVDMEDWVGFLLKQKLATLTVYGRTPEQLSKGPMDWEGIGRIVEMKNELSPDTIIIGNGDVKSYGEAIEKHKEYKVDGVMIGRGIFHNPWVFERTSNPTKRTREDHLKVLRDHMNLFVETWGKKKNFAILKKFFKIYVKDFDGATEIRDRLMKSKNKTEVEAILSEL